MCNFYSITEPRWKEIAMKAVVFGAIVTFSYLYVISSMICYSKWFQEEEENTKKFKTKFKLSNNPTVRLLGKIGP